MERREQLKNLQRQTIPSDRVTLAGRVVAAVEPAPVMSVDVVVFHDVFVVEDLVPIRSRLLRHRLIHSHSTGRQADFDYDR